MDVEDIKEEVDKKYRKDIRQSTKKVYEQANKEHPLEKRDNDSDVWYVWVPLKYDLGDVGDKKNEIVNDLVDGLYFSTKKIQPRPITMPEGKLLDMKLRDENESIIPDNQNQNLDENQNREREQIEKLEIKKPILTAENTDIILPPIDTKNKEESERKPKKRELEPRNELNLEEEQKNRPRNEKTYTENIEVGKLEQTDIEMLPDNNETNISPRKYNINIP